ncbi:hypothetical protein vseg_018284 [Gypsophila vaccaria]
MSTPRATPFRGCDTPTTSDIKRKTRRNHNLLKHLHIYGILAAQIIASAVLITVMLWLFIRLPEPEVHVTGFNVDAINGTTTTTRTFLHYNMTLHNPDRYKSLSYDVLVLRITYSGYRSRSYGATVNFIQGGKGVWQSPGETTLLSNHTVNYTDSSVGWEAKDMVELKKEKTNIYLRFVMEVRFIAFTKVIATRQMMRTAEVYFDDSGNPFLNHRRGLMLK